MEFVICVQNGDTKELKRLLEQIANTKEEEKGQSAKECTQLLLDYEMCKDINIKDDAGATPLAAGEGKTECAALLIERKAFIDAVDFGGETPLHWAALNGHREVVDLLLQKGANMNAQADNGFTPLHSATINCHPKCIAALLNKGADLNLKDKKGKTPKELAEERKYTNLMDVFNTEKRETYERVVLLENEVEKLKEELKKAKADHGVTSKKLMDVYRELLAVQEQNKETTAKNLALQQENEKMKTELIECQKEKEKRVHAEEELKALLQEYKELMQSNVTLQLELENLKNSPPSSNENSSATSDGSSAVVSENSVVQKDAAELVAIQSALDNLRQLLNTAADSIAKTNLQINNYTNSS